MLSFLYTSGYRRDLVETYPRVTLDDEWFSANPPIYVTIADSDLQPPLYRFRLLKANAQLG